MYLVLNEIVAVGPPDFIYLPVFSSDAANLTIQAREDASLDHTIMASADGAISQYFVDAVDEFGEGMYFSAPILSFSGRLYKEFELEHMKKYGQLPISVFHPHAFDATNMILACIEQVAIIEEDSTIHIGRAALRDCLYTTKDFEGITGNLTCNQFGDCGAGEFAISQIQDGEYIRFWP